MRHHLIPSPTARTWFQHPAYRQRHAQVHKERPFRPATNIVETDEGFELTIVAPGRSKEDFKIELKDKFLLIRTETPEDDRTYQRQEFVLKGFERKFELPQTIEATAIAARYENGLLVLHLPKKEEAKPQAPRSIEIA